MTGTGFIQIDASQLEAYRRDFTPQSAKALVNAFKAEALRLKTIISQEFATGVGPSPAPLTQQEQKNRSSAALSFFGRFVAYEVSNQGGDLIARIGISRAITRAKNAEGKKRQIVALLEGGSHPITREDQAAIAYKLRLRLGDPVQRPSGADVKGRRWWGKRGRFESGKRHWADIGAFLPPVGASLSWPGRDYAAQTVAAEADTSRANIQRLYAMALNGLRWANRWWG